MKTRPFMMIAEDDPDDQFFIQSAVEAECPPEVETHFAWDGVDLLSTLDEKLQQYSKPNLIVLDLNMPRKDGRQVLKEIRTNNQLDGIPIAILTTSGSDEDIRYCQDLGIVGYYRKPSSMTELRDIMHKLCEEYLG